MSRLKHLLAALLIGFIAAPAWCGAAGPAAVVKGIRVFPSGDNFGIEISADKDLVYTCTRMPTLRRVIIDLPGTDPGRPETDYKVDSAMVSFIRLQKRMINDDLVTRILVNLLEDADYTARLDPADKKKLTIILSRPAAGSAGSVTGAAQPLPPELSPAPAAPAPRPEVNVATAAPGPSVTVTGVSFSPDAIDIQTGGAVHEFRAFTLDEPGRLVIDIAAAQSPLRSIAVPANRFGIRTARIGNFEGKLRLVFDSGGKSFPGYSVAKTGTGLRVVVGK